MRNERLKVKEKEFEEKLEAFRTILKSPQLYALFTKTITQTADSFDETVLATSKVSPNKDDEVIFNEPSRTRN